MTWLTAQRTAGLLFAFGVAITIIAGILHYLTRDVPVEYFGIRGFQGVFGLVIIATGWLILSKRPRNAIAWVFVASGLASCLQAFDSAYGTYSIARHGGRLPGTDLFTWLGVWIWVLIIGPLSTFVPILFPDGTTETKRQRHLLIFSSVSLVIFAAVTSLSPGQAGELPLGVRNPFAISERASQRLAPSMMLFVVAVVLSIATLVGRFRRSMSQPHEGEYEPSPWDWVRRQVEVYEGSAGARGNTLGTTGLPIIVVTLRGHRTGKIRKVPLMRVEHEGSYALIGSQGGAPKDPLWVKSIRADPDGVMIQDGPKPFDVTVREPEGRERDDWWTRAVDAFPPYADYQARTERRIPLFVATPV